MGSGSRRRGGRRHNRSRARQARRQNSRRINRHHTHVNSTHHAHHHHGYLPRGYSHHGSNGSLGQPASYTHRSTRSLNHGECEPKVIGIAAALCLCLPGLLLTALAASGILGLSVMVVGGLVLGIGIIVIAVSYVLHVRHEKRKANIDEPDPEVGSTAAQPVPTIQAPVILATSSRQAAPQQQITSSFQSAPMERGPSSSRSSFVDMHHSLPEGTAVNQPPSPQHGSRPELTTGKRTPPPIFGIQTFTTRSVVSLRPSGPIAQSSPMTQHTSPDQDISFPSESSVEPVFRNELPTYDQLYPRGPHRLDYYVGTANLGFESVSLRPNHSSTC